MTGQDLNVSLARLLRITGGRKIQVNRAMLGLEGGVGHDIVPQPLPLALVKHARVRERRPRQLRIDDIRPCAALSASQLPLRSSEDIPEMELCFDSSVMKLTACWVADWNTEWRDPLGTG